MTFTNIKKRNGQVVEFEPKRIEIAIQKASDSVDSEVPAPIIAELVENVISHLEALNGDSIPDVESIQDLVEQELMRADYYKTARSYILYRERHKELREFESNRDAEKLEHNELKVTLPDGTIDYFSYTRLIKDLVTASEGIESSIDIDELAQIAKSNLYDGITLEELQDSLILAAKSCIEKDHAYSTLAARLLLKKIYREVIGTDKEDKIVEAYKDIYKDFIKSAVKSKRLDGRLLEFDLDELAEYIDYKRDGLFDYMGLDMLHDRYFIQNEGRGVRLETPQILWMRIAMGLAIQEKKSEREKWTKKFYDTLSTLRYVPSTPTLFHSGTTFAQLSSCFLNTVED
ncbi:MAG TPA: ATP cone domain-containing protein, partial [Candidatus Saccharibacteria bacterium]|nr:ATP cone domain-containing protein [Candidatus Saccharibacteria bacterium]